MFDVGYAKHTKLQCTAGNVSNYRPISLTYVPAKLTERVIADCVLSYLMDNNLLHPVQHGF